MLFENAQVEVMKQRVYSETSHCFSLQRREDKMLRQDAGRNTENMLNVIM